MLQKNALSQTKINQRLDQLALFIVNAMLVCALLVLITAPFLAYRWAQQPFIGAFFEQTLVFNSVESQGSTTWEGIKAGLKYPAQLISIDEQNIQSTGQISEILEKRAIGEEITIQFDTGKSIGQRTIKLQKFPTYDFSAFFLVPYILGWAYLLIGLWVYRVRWHNSTGRAFMIFCAAMSISIGGLFDLYTTHFYTWLWTLSLPVLAASLLGLGLVFPQKAMWLEKYPTLVWVGALPATILIVFGEWAVYGSNDPRRYIRAWQQEYLFVFLAILFFLGLSFYRRLKAPTMIMRDQARVIVLGSVLAFSPIAYYMARATVEPIGFNVSIFFPPLGFFPLAIGYAILRHRLLNTDRLIMRGLAYTMLAALAGVGYVFLTTLAQRIMGSVIPVDNSAFIIGTIITIMLVFVFNPLRVWVQKKTDVLFFGRTRALRERVLEFGRFLKSSVDFDQVVLALRQALESTVQPTEAHLFARNEESGSFNFYPVIQNKENISKGYGFDSDSPLANFLKNEEEGTVFLTLDQDIPHELEVEREKLVQLNTTVFFPFSIQSGLAGWLALGSSLTGEPYNRDDLIFLESIGDQVASAIERTWLFTAERQNYNVVEALKDTAAALTSTLDLDLLLDRILLDVGHVVPHDAINVMLIDNDVVHVVRRRGNEKYLEEAMKSNLQMSVNKTPSLIKMRKNRKPELVHNTHEHPDWVDLPESRWVRSYLGAPIRNKGQVIGFLNLNSNTPNFFNAAHAQHLLAFADQAGAAIENSRLFNGLEKANAELIAAYDATLEGWVHALDLRDKETEGHSQRVTKLTVRLAEALGVQPDEMVHIRRGALLHDIGKIGVPDQILHKPGPLTGEERHLMNQHPIYSYEMLSSIEFLRPAIDIPYSHHERWDGTGYPQGLAGEAIPLAARIFMIVDVWDALVSNRPYRKAMPPSEVIAYLREEAGSHFDPSLVKPFVNLPEIQLALQKEKTSA